MQCCLEKFLLYLQQTISAFQNTIQVAWLPLPRGTPERLPAKQEQTSGAQPHRSTSLTQLARSARPPRQNTKPRKETRKLRLALSCVGNPANRQTKSLLLDSSPETVTANRRPPYGYRARTPSTGHSARDGLRAWG